MLNKTLILPALAMLGWAVSPAMAAPAGSQQFAQMTTAPAGAAPTGSERNQPTGAGPGPMVVSPPGAVPATGSEQTTRTPQQQQKSHTGHNTGQATPHVTGAGNPVAKNSEGGAEPHNAFPAGTHKPVERR